MATRVSTCTQTKYFDVVPEFFSGQGKQSWGEEHCFIVWMGNQKAYALMAKMRKGSACDLRSVKPSCRKEDWDGDSDIKLHLEYHRILVL